MAGGIDAVACSVNRVNHSRIPALSGVGLLMSVHDSTMKPCCSKRALYWLPEGKNHGD